MIPPLRDNRKYVTLRSVLHPYSGDNLVTGVSG